MGTGQKQGPITRENLNMLYSMKYQYKNHQMGKGTTSPGGRSTSESISKSIVAFDPHAASTEGDQSCHPWLSGLEASISRMPSLTRNSEASTTPTSSFTVEAGAGRPGQSPGVSLSDASSASASLNSSEMGGTGREHNG